MKKLRCDKVLGKEWNPIIGCSPISPGCMNCYARELHQWLAKMKKAGYDQPFNKVRFMPDRLDDPLKWKGTKEIQRLMKFGLREFENIQNDSKRVKPLSWMSREEAICFDDNRRGRKVEIAGRSALYSNSH